MGQSPGTFWYHAHKHGSTAINVANGMTGVFIIEGQYDDDLNKFYGANWTRTQPVLVINQLGVTPNLERIGPGRIDKGPDFSVNGRLQPHIKMYPGEVQMWRIVNTSGRSGAFFAGPPKSDPTAKAVDPAKDFEWKQLAQDGVQFFDSNYQKSLDESFLMAAGNRVDLLVKAPTQPTREVFRRARAACGRQGRSHDCRPGAADHNRHRRDWPCDAVHQTSAEISGGSRRHHG